MSRLTSAAMFELIIFDMDGVLIDSEEYMAKTGVRALRKYGIDAKESDFAEFVGCGENRYVGGVAEKYGVSIAEFYADMARAFLMDKDGPGAKEKLAAYYHGIVKAE